MKKLFYFSSLALGCIFLSCSKEEVLPISTPGAVPATRISIPVDCRIPISRSLNLRALPELGERFAFKKETRVKIEQMHSTNYSINKYSGTCLIATGLVMEFSVQEQFNSVGAFVMGRSHFKLNGKNYETVDYPDEGKDAIVSFLSLRLNDGRLIPQQGYIIRKILYLFQNVNDIGNGEYTTIKPLHSNPQTDTHLSVIKQNAQIQFSGTILRLPAH